MVIIAKRKNVLLLYGYHPDESYAINVVKEVEKLALPDVVVKEFKLDEFPRYKRTPQSTRPLRTGPRKFYELMKKNDAKWVIDVHSHKDGTVFEPHVMKNRFLAILGYGYKFENDYEKLWPDFFYRHYNGEDVLSTGVQGQWSNMCKGSFTLGLPSYAPLKEGVNLVKNLAEYLKALDP